MVDVFIIILVIVFLLYLVIRKSLAKKLNLLSFHGIQSTDYINPILLLSNWFTENIFKFS